MNSLQEQYAAKSICFGCGPSNVSGLHVQSFPVDLQAQGLEIQLTARWSAKEHYQAFPGMLNGGIIGALLDCHSNWTAAYVLMKDLKLDQPPCTVTAEFSVKLLRPTPIVDVLRLVAKPVEIKGDRVWVQAELFSGPSEKPCATCKGLFVAVKPGHPAYHRW